MFFFASCVEPTYDNTVEKLTVVKSEEILSETCDTINIVRNDNIIYEVKDNKIIARYYLFNHNQPKNNNIMVGDLIVLLLIAFIVGAMFIGIMTSD